MTKLHYFARALGASSDVVLSDRRAIKFGFRTANTGWHNWRALPRQLKFKREQLRRSAYVIVLKINLGS
jgi:hypothetical protein